ncbi:membrane protein [Azorhizobium oxalatiphilum]|uniref:Membrane protein n=1 Tax=Azorhizobium oxalatiphilum TaxID=980631 RepID=A0A917C0S8_9HYPH|nr:heme biosynthesis HemY N-terminal domain-containing protein [Azorhizobium oxalatiphilum]GGF64342.1 membrane protein [Azorhizobium oxalatiphilum]
MIRLVLFLIVLALVAFGASWLADRPGEMLIAWQGWRIETTVPVALAALAAFSVALLVVWHLLSLLIRSPKLLVGFSRRRKREKGWAAVSRGLLAIGSGDIEAAKRARADAQKYLPREPLTQLLAAQSAQFAGDQDEALRVFRTMLDEPGTRLLGLRGLHIEARRSGDIDASRVLAEEAANQDPALTWAADAVMEARCAEGDYPGARAVLEKQMSHRGIDKLQYRRRRAVLLAAEALALEVSDPPVARERAVEAVRLAPTLVPAAAVAGRLLGNNGDLRKATKIVETAYAATPHPELADVAARLRPGDAALDRLKRIRALAAKAPDHPESLIALAHGTIDAQQFAEARALLQRLSQEPTQRVCLLMAELEATEHEDVGKAREWAARALRAPRDPAWIADGRVFDEWGPVSPVTGKLDAFIWAVPPGVSATPVLEHEAERVRTAIAAIREKEEARREVERAAELEKLSHAAPVPATAEDAKPVDAKPAETKPAIASPATAKPAPAKSVEAPPPVVALPPLPDDPGPVTDAETAEPAPARKRLFGL